MIEEEFDAVICFIDIGIDRFVFEILVVFVGIGLDQLKSLARVVVSI